MQMKISIWQQFSSNHSNDFHIVGEFKTTEDAHRAGEKLQKVLDQLEDYYEKHEPETYAEPNAVEKLIAKEHDIEIRAAIDWVVDNAKQRAFRVYDKTLFLSSLYQHHSLIHNSFLDLLEKLGANVIETSIGGSLITVEFDAPTVQHAIEWENQVKIYHQSVLDVRAFYYPPWIGYYLGEFDAELDQLAKHWQNTRELVEKKEQNALHNFDDESIVTEYDKWLTTTYQADKQNTVLQMFMRIESANSEHHPLRNKLIHAVGDIGFPVRRVFKYCTEVIRTDNHLKLFRLSFGSAGCGLEAVIAWAKAQNCTNITYSWEIAEDCWQNKP